MPRTTDATLLAALAADNLQPALFIALTFATGTAYVWSGVGSVTWNGQTWSGLGDLLKLSTIEDGSNVEARGTAVTLSGLDSSLLSDSLNDFVLGLPLAIYIGLYVSGTLYSVPLSSWIGRMDQPTIEVSGDTCTITVNCETRLVDMNIPIDRRYTSQDQQMDWPQDQGMNFVDSIQEITTFWMQYPNNTNNV